MMRNPEQTIGNLISKCGLCAVASIDSDGFPNIKEMYAPAEREGIKTFLFSTNTSSRRTWQFLTNPKAAVYFHDRRFFRGVQLIGIMEVLTDSDTKELVWREGNEKYYPLGVTDPDYCVLRFTAIKGRYYSNFKSEDFDV